MTVNIVIQEVVLNRSSSISPDTVKYMLNEPLYNVFSRFFDT